MKKVIFLSMAAILFLVNTGNTQPFDKLNQLKDHAVQVYYSSGFESRASSITKRVDKAMAYYRQLLDFKPAVTLLVLSQADWSTYTNFPVYGMPHYNNDKTLIVAAEDNAFWKSFLPPLNQLTPEIRKQVETVYRRPDGSLSMEAFFDLLALHELGHAFHFQGKLNMQRKWMGELFVNILLHTYIAENEPASLPALTLFPQMVISNGTKEFTYTSLEDVEERYDEIGKQHAKNYGWYQSRWHAAARTIYDAAGKSVCRNLWNAFNEKKERMTDEQLVIFLEKSADKSVADLVKNWGRDTKN
ncbi:MAG TPA: hypothetical protein PKY28_04715 [Ferruginibacter sp.]|nr:hypothetical protein [Ferruginibacter sp.]